MLSDISKAVTECVSAPHEMKSTPVAAMAATVASVTLPEASVSNRPAMSSNSLPKKLYINAICARQKRQRGMNSCRFLCTSMLPI